MFRSVIAFCLLALFLCSVGCRICTTPHDYRISTYIDRCDDYRGFHPLYRAGSIFGGWNGAHQVGYTHHEGTYGEYTDYYTNAGNYGITTPISTVRYTPDTDVFDSQQGTEQSPIAIPDHHPGNNGLPFSPGRFAPDRTPNGIPSIGELIDRERGSIQLPTPLAPPVRQGTVPSFEGMPGDSLPFSPSDALPNGVMPGNTVPNDGRLTPPSTFPKTMETDLPVTLEELRRLDPTIQDVQIISIEDVAPDALIR